MFCNSLRGVSRRDVIYETRKTTRKSIDFLKNELTLIWTQEYMKYRLPPPPHKKIKQEIKFVPRLCFSNENITYYAAMLDAIFCLLDRVEFKLSQKVFEENNCYFIVD